MSRTHGGPPPGGAGDQVAPARILLVDDDHDLVDILKLVLEQHGHHVLAAYNAPEGLRLAEQERPDLLILDVMMPEGTEGFHFVWNLRSRPEAWFREVPIIMLTAVHQRSPLRFYPDTGDGSYRPGEYLAVDEFLDKPIDPVVLIRTVDRVLRTARQGPTVTS